MLLCEGLSLILVFPFTVFEDSHLLGDVSCGFSDFVLDARVYGFTIGGSPSIICILLFYDSWPSISCAGQDSL